MSDGGWRVIEHEERPGAFHARPIPDALDRQVWVSRPTAPALVLGSAQRDDVVDRDACARAGFEVVRRRSGGGAVLVVPGQLVWVDVLLPAGDPLWRDDVGRAFLWLGEAWQRALAELGVPAAVHDGPMVRTAWSDLVCFAGLGPGELIQRRADGAAAKVVGISQRRTRAGARFQCAALLGWDPATLLALLALDDAARDAAATALAGVGAPVDRPAGAVLDALLGHLPT